MILTSSNTQNVVTQLATILGAMGMNVGGDGAEMTMMSAPLQNWLVGVVLMDVTLALEKLGIFLVNAG